MKSVFPFIFFVFLASAAFSQSSFYNPAFNPQPRILIPSVEPERYTGTTTETVTVSYTNNVLQFGAITQIVGDVTSVFSVVTGAQEQVVSKEIETESVVENSLYNLKYVDFLIKAVDQSGEYLTGDNPSDPVLWACNSAGTNSQPAAKIFYQNDSLSWPQYTQRKRYFLDGMTNYYSSTNSWLTTNEFHTAWPRYSVYVGAETGLTTNWPAVVYLNTNAVNAEPYNQHFDTNAMLGAVALNFDGVNSNEFTSRVYPKYYGEEGTNVWRYWRSTGNYSEGNAFSWLLKKNNESYRSTPLYYGWGVFDNHFLYGSKDTNDFEIIVNYSTNHWSVIQPQGMVAASSNAASSIEVYPSLAGNREWMRPNNPSIKWMVALSNGIDFYRDAAGNVVWFTAVIDWVKKIPSEGIWE